MGAISILGVGHCHMLRFLNSKLREMECAERLRFAPRRLLSSARGRMWADDLNAMYGLLQRCCINRHSAPPDLLGL